MKTSFTLFLLLSVLSFRLYADPGSTLNNIDPKRAIEEVHVDSVAEEVQKLKNPRILIADYDLIRKDFPSLKNLSNPQIDHWLLDQTGYISIPQKNQTEVNTAIEVLAETRKAHRPPHYGRALVYEMLDPETGNQIGLIDLKGSGALKPAQKSHRNGIATLGECLREYVFEHMMRDIFKDSGLPQKTVGSYAVIDPGFDLVHSDGSRSPGGFYLRQAHDRVPEHSGAWLPESKRMSIQKVLHQYGIDPNKNVQGTVKHNIFDFGHYIVRDDTPGIDPSKQVSFDIWGYDKNIQAPGDDRWFYSKVDNAWNWSHELATNWRKGLANRDHVWQHFKNLVLPVREKLTRKAGSSCASLVGKIITD
ncbi:MAG: hypothetical protein HN509_15385 [Halobacteriovoraceae bacterium]|jgi:hypothetical protein|nr:hypothetical protein [Halobacteriovoraceae bacterium]MBT5093480.1 hypothetical protein [Halobacteriovoraceae bacterium]